MPLPIENREQGESVRTKINESFTNISALESSTAVLQSQINILDSQVGVKKEFETVALLLADTGTYTNYATGDYFRVVNGGFSYQVAASGASDHHVATAGGVKLYVLPGDAGYNVKAFGAKGDGAADDTTAIQVALNAGAQKVVIPSGNYLTATGIDVGSNTQLEMAKGANLLAGANGIVVVRVGSGSLCSAVNLSNISVVGNAKTGVTGIRLRYVQFNSHAVGLNVFDCEYGIILDSVCIGVHLDTPTTYSCPNGIQVLSSNANVITAPNIDNTPATGGANNGTGIYITGSSNCLSGGFVQGFEYGFRDQGDYNTYTGVYVELCTSAGWYLDGALGPILINPFFYGENASASACYLAVLGFCGGASIHFPRMVQGNSTGGLFFASTGNTECYAIWATDGGTTNTNLGTTTQINKIAKQVFNSFTATLTGCTTSPTGDVFYAVTGGQCVLQIPFISATSNTTAMTLTGAPTAIRPTRDQTVLCRVIDNGVSQLGLATIATTGVITLNLGAGAGVFTAAGSKGLPVQTITYMVD